MRTLNFVHQDSNIRVRRQTTEQDEIFANHISGKGLISRIHRELIKLNNQIPLITQFKNGQRT